jgi:pyrimidine operon attenuation protein/uracil phosphoribosyltransferase
MNKVKVLILDKERIQRKLQRMAYEIWEQNSKETEITLIGIAGTGAVVARNLAKILGEISPLKVELLIFKINKRHPAATEVQLEHDLQGKILVLVDDVANSGKTLLYALKPLLTMDLKKVMITVLVERKHKAFPVSPDIVGHSVATTLQDRIEVETEDDEIVAAYLQ